MMSMESTINMKIEETLAKLSTTVNVPRVKEPPDQQPVATPMHGWPFLPSVTQAPIGLVLEALPRLHLEPPRFDGENAADWIHKIQKYYNYHNTPLDDRLYLAKYLFDDQASDWMTFWEENNKGKSWDDFLLAVKQRFDPDLYDYVGRLATLRQNSSVEAYQTLFKALLPKASHVGDSMLSYLFIAGLKPPLKQRVLLRRPSTLQETFSIAQQLQACCAATTSPGPFTRTGGTSRDQRQPNRTTPHPDVNQEPDRQPPQLIKEITHVSDVNQFGVQPLNAVSSQSFAKGSGPKIFICNGSMNKNTESIIDIVSKAIGSDTMSCSEDLETISKALNINNGVIVADDIEEQPAQVQALAETDSCTEFIDSVNPQSVVPADQYSQPLLSRGGPKVPLEEGVNKGVSTDLTGRSNAPAIIFDSYITVCENNEEETPATWDPGESTRIPRSIADASDEEGPECLRTWRCVNSRLYVEGNTTRQVVDHGQRFSDDVCRDVVAPNDGKVTAFSNKEIFVVRGERLDYSWVIIASAGFGASCHIGPNSTSARSAIVGGSTNWRLFEHDVMQHMIHMSSDGIVVARPFSIIERIVHIYNAAAKNWEQTIIEIVVNVVFDYEKLVEGLNSVVIDHSESTEPSRHYLGSIPITPSRCSFPTGHFYYDFHFHLEDESHMFLFHYPP